ncbi:MAG: hypothetical protein V2B19_27725 [Pseudomonadota bacterium]
MEQVIKIDRAGEIHLPREILATLDLRAEDRLMVTSSADTIVIKKITTGTLGERFRTMAERVSRQFEERGVTQADVAEAVTWSRK